MALSINNNKMNNNIEEDYCSFEVSKLLKEKGFAVLCSHYYFEDGEFKQNEIKDTIGMDYGADITYNLTEFNENWNDGGVTKKNGDRCFGCNKSKNYFETFSAPTHSLAIKWVRENFHINVWIRKSNTTSLWFWRIDTNISYKIPETDRFNTPEEAIEAALLYTLQNLIL